MNSILHASYLNQQGASLLLEGDVEKAAPFFRKALEIIQVDFPNLLSAPLPPLSTATVGDVRRGQISRPLETSKAFVYFKPFFFNQNTIFNEHEIGAYLAIMTYNLALCYQLEAHSFQDGGRVLNRAKMLYQNVLDLLNNAWQHDCSNVIIASLNNLAALFVELSEHHDACKILALLSAFLNEEGVRTDTLDKSDLRDIILNVCLIPFPTCAEAA